MAESINLILESMLPHLEELQQAGIFQENEIRDVVKKRRQMEYQLFRRPPKKEDFLKAIEFEHNLDKLCKLRKERLGVAGMSQDGEFGIVNRIHGLYRRATKHFKGDVSLWLQHIKHSRLMNQQSMTSRLFGKALSIHPTRVGLWIMAAKFEFEERQDTSAARVLFQEGLRANGDSQKLWLEYYRMELLAVDKLRKRKNVLMLNNDDGLPNDDVMDYAVSSIVYKEAIKSIPDNISFRLSFLTILIQFDDTSKREQGIFDNLVADFPKSGLVHDAIAKRSWLRISNEDSLLVSKVKELERETESLYREGIAKLSRDAEVCEEEEPILWEKYILWSVERLQYWTRKKGKTNESGIAKLLNICSECSSKKKLSESLAMKLVQLLQANSLRDHAAVLIKEMVVLYPSSSQLWLARLHCEIMMKTEFEDLVEIFHEAISSVGEEIQIWQLYISQVILRQSSFPEIESVFKECLQALPSSRAEPILLQYLDWVYVIKGIKSIRSIYKNLSKSNHQCLSVSVYMKCISFEMSEATVNNRRVCDLFEASLTQYGTTSTDLWLDYIKTLTLLGSVKEVSDIYWRAIRTLDGGLTAQFMSRHSSCIVAS